MPQARKYMAASVPRFLRQTRLGYLPLHCVIGSHSAKGNQGVNLFFDIVMLPVNEFQRMKTNIGLQHVNALTLKMGPTFAPGFVLADMKEVMVPEGEPDPETYARNYFLMLFGLVTPEAPAELSPNQAFSVAAKQCTKPSAGKGKQSLPKNSHDPDNMKT